MAGKKKKDMKVSGIQIPETVVEPIVKKMKSKKQFKASDFHGLAKELLVANRLKKHIDLAATIVSNLVKRLRYEGTHVCSQRGKDGVWTRIAK